MNRWRKAWKSRNTCGNVVLREQSGEMLVVRCNRPAPWSYAIAPGLVMHRCPECKAFVDMVEAEAKRAITTALAKGKA